MLDILLDNVVIRLDDEGRFCLNDLHKAAGGEKRHQPSDWLRLLQTKSLIEEIINEKGEIPPVVAKQGLGTFVVKELLLSYAAWISPTVFVHLSKSLTSLESIMEAMNAFEVPDDLPDLYVYAIREKTSGNIKIGISRDPKRRLSTLQTGNSDELELVAIKRAENKFDDEQSLHELAAPYHVRGEWFNSRAIEVFH